MNCEKETFRFLEVNIEDMKKDILRLDKNNVSQHSETPFRIIEKNLNILADFYVQTLTALSNHLRSHLV